jgi:hypothetical protein
VVIKSRRVSRDGCVGNTEMERNAGTVLVRKLESKTSLSNSRFGWKDNVKMDLKCIGWKNVYWIG